MKEKHTSYYTLLETFNNDMCPICYIMENKIEKYFDDLLYENINNYGFRKEFDQNEGFCNYHSHKLLSYNDVLASSIINQALLKTKLNKYMKKKFKKKKNKCQVCEQILQIEKRYIDLLIDYIDDEEILEAFYNSKGLCIPHFELLNRTKKVSNQMFNFQIKVYQSIINSLEPYIDSFNYSLGSQRIKLNKEKMIEWNNNMRHILGFEGLRA